MAAIAQQYSITPLVMDGYNSTMMDDGQGLLTTHPTLHGTSLTICLLILVSCGILGAMGNLSYLRAVLFDRKASKLNSCCFLSISLMDTFLCCVWTSVEVVYVIQLHINQPILKELCQINSTIHTLVVVVSFLNTIFIIIQTLISKPYRLPNFVKWVGLTVPWLFGLFTAVLYNSSPSSWKDDYYCQFWIIPTTLRLWTIYMGFYILSGITMIILFIFLVYKTVCIAKGTAQHDCHFDQGCSNIEVNTRSTEASTIRAENPRTNTQSATNTESVSSAQGTHVIFVRQSQLFDRDEFSEAVTIKTGNVSFDDVPVQSAKKDCQSVKTTPCAIKQTTSSADSTKPLPFERKESVKSNFSREGSGRRFTTGSITTPGEQAYVAQMYTYVRKWSIDIEALQDQLENPKIHGGNYPYKELKQCDDKADKSKNKVTVFSDISSICKASPKAEVSQREKGKRSLKRKLSRMESITENNINTNSFNKVSSIKTDFSALDGASETQCQGIASGTGSKRLFRKNSKKYLQNPQSTEFDMKTDNEDIPSREDIKSDSMPSRLFTTGSGNRKDNTEVINETGEKYSKTKPPNWVEKRKLLGCSLIVLAFLLSIMPHQIIQLMRDALDQVLFINLHTCTSVLIMFQAVIHPHIFVYMSQSLLKLVSNRPKRYFLFRWISCLPTENVMSISNNESQA